MARRFAAGSFIVTRASLLFASMLLLGLGAATTFAQKPADVVGDWSGVLQPSGGSLRLALHVSTDSAGKLTVTLDSLDQGAMGLAGGNAVLDGNGFSFDIPSVSGTYSGTLGSDGKSISGTWSQGAPLPLVFTRQRAAQPKEVVGNWIGALPAGGGSLRLALHVTADSSGKLSVTLDSIDQHAMGLAGKNAVLKGDSLSFEIPSVSGTYTGALDGDGKNIRGTWSQGVPQPLVFTRQNGGPMPTAMPTPTPAPAIPPVTLDNLKPVLDRELAPVLEHGLLSQPSGGGLVIGVMDHGQRRIFAYGTAKPDSIFEIGSISKTFTGLVLAQMVVQKKVTLDTPIRTLLPAGFVAKSEGAEITLVDLATQHSGLPRMPDNFKPQNPLNPYADYHATQLQEFIARHGVAKPADAAFLYSNLGFGLLGYGLSLRAGVPYEQLVATEVTGPLHMSDTGVTLSPAQRSRLIQGYDTNFDPTPPWDMDVFAGAGAIKSTAADMLTYLDANLHPDKYANGAAADSPAARWPATVALDHQVRANVTANGNTKIALAWFFNPKAGSYFHSGGTGGYRSLVGFNTAQDRAIVVLYNRDNQDPAAPQLVERVVENVDELMTGKPSIPLDFVSEQERRVLVPATFTESSIHGPYHCTLTPFSLPPTIKDPFKATGTGDIHIVADGNGKYSEGTWVDRIRAPGLDLTCKLKLVSGSYSVTPNGTGTGHSSWKLVTEESPRGCFQFFSPARPPVTTDSELIMTDPAGRIVYSTSINPAAVLNTVCQSETAH
jgi:serine-type D-Ala-D-Ala carboxypeptidase/endopeptidase